MSRLCLATDQLRANDITYAVRDEDGSGHETLLRRARNIRHTHGDDETDDRPEEAHDGVPDDRGDGPVSPRALPDHDAAGHDGQAEEYDEWDAQVRDPRGQPAGKQNEDQADAAEGKLEEDAVEGRVAERGDDEGAETADGAVDGVATGLWVSGRDTSAASLPVC